MNTEGMIVESVKVALERTFGASSEDLDRHLASEGFHLKPYDLDFILKRHPLVFRTDYRGRWMLA